MNPNIIETAGTVAVGSSALLGVIIVCLKSNALDSQHALKLRICCLKIANRAVTLRYLVILRLFRIRYFIRVNLCHLRYFLRMRFFFACYLLAKLRLDLLCRIYLVAYKFNMFSHLRRVCAVYNKLANSIQMLREFHNSVPMTPNESKLSHSHWLQAQPCNDDSQCSYRGQNRRGSGCWLQRVVRPMVFHASLFDIKGKLRLPQKDKASSEA